MALPIGKCIMWARRRLDSVFGIMAVVGQRMRALRMRAAGAAAGARLVAPAEGSGAAGARAAGAAAGAAPSASGGRF